MIAGIIRRKPVLTHASIVCYMLASVNSENRPIFMTHKKLKMSESANEDAANLLGYVGGLIFYWHSSFFLLSFFAA